MKKLKACLHLHTEGDPKDSILYSPESAIKKAAELKFDVVSITCHDKVIWSEKLRDYAARRKILLIPGIEKTIEGKHVLLINADREAENLHTFQALGEYKKSHPFCAVIAPHPFHLYPPLIHPQSLGNKLTAHIDLFDAVELSFYYLEHLDFNEKAKKIAAEYSKPLVGTSDIHDLKYFNNTYTLIESQKETAQIIQAIKQGKVEIVTKPLTLMELFDATIEEFVRMPVRNLLKKRSMVELVRK